MLVQDRSHPHPSSAPKTLDLSSFLSDHLYKLLALFLLAATVPAILLFRSAAADSATLLCLHPPTPSLSFPRPRFSSVPPLPDLSSPFSSLRHPLWIVVSSSSSSSASLLRLSRIPGFQLLIVATSPSATLPLNSTPSSAIFLSLDLQSRLRFRILPRLPPSSPLRKSLGYLFAIQHGARLIFDADSRSRVVSGNLSRRFDLDLVGEGADRLPFLQYSHHLPNRSVVNPYVHFGQRSVWPRGLPIELASRVSPEEFYTETYGGRQFIQQGLSNGLPDVDSVFYFTRKARLEAFDIRFDDEAPKVSLPQGIMAPINSFNTIFHSPAFWGLMLPVSVSSMASDVLRGYWAQRILWEIGGSVAFYPPTVHRVDRIQAYPFAEEKDLHVNVGRLIEFLIKWRSNKPTLFERIVHLSYSMAEEGFWSELDVKLTVDWLQDLLAVGYQQPRLMALELDRPRASIGHGDRREFVPKKLPSVHLGVEETGAVSDEIGNLIKWRKNFGNLVLVMFCSKPVDRTALEWRLLYGRIFKTVIILSENNSTDLAVEYGHLPQAYKYLPKIFKQFSGAEGFLFLQDDTILNYWNLLEADKTKLWIADKVSEAWMTVSVEPKTWFSEQAELVARALNSLPAHFQARYRESVKQNSLVLCTSEIFFVPRRFTGDFADLVALVGNLELHHKIAVPMFFMAMDSPHNFDSSALQKMIYRTDQSNVSMSIYSAEAPAVHPFDVSNEMDFIHLIRVMAKGDPLLMEMV